MVACIQVIEFLQLDFDDLQYITTSTKTKTKTSNKTSPNPPSRILPAEPLPVTASTSSTKANNPPNPGTVRRQTTRPWFEATTGRGYSFPQSTPREEIEGYHPNMKAQLRPARYMSGTLIFRKMFASEKLNKTLSPRRYNEDASEMWWIREKN
jgi:hypothetical protein